jgi:glycosyltransferase involved in cell wall biosynthesis
LVSVVIPTVARPTLVLRAVHSALQQTFRDLEVIVIANRSEKESLDALESISSPQLRLVLLPRQVDGSRARNEGVHAARGEWVAFLDDDDLWVPEKLEKQLDAAQMSTASDPIIACKVTARTPEGEFIWPRKLPSEPLSEYLLARDSLRKGEGLLQTSTLLARKSLLLKIGFQEGLNKHQDWDWLLRAINVPGVKIEFVDEPLAIWDLGQSRDSVSRNQDWQDSLTWIRDRRALVTRRAYAGFIATQIASQAARQKEWKAFFPLLTEMLRLGKPKVIDILLLLGMWFVPPYLRERLRSC